jgi:hypothetical protein
VVGVGLRFFLRAFGRASLRQGRDEHYATHSGQLKMVNTY